MYELETLSFLVRLDTHLQRVLYLKVKMRNALKFRTDGGSRGNPGPSASAVYFPDAHDGLGFFLGTSRTNNEAEAAALLHGLKYAIEHGYDSVDVCCDSTLIVNQATGKWAVRSENMQKFMDEIQVLLYKLDNPKLTYIPREENREADWVVNQVLNKFEEGERLVCPTYFKIPWSRPSSTPVP